MTLYLALEGPDGCGKSTQASSLVRWLGAQGHSVLHLREPGSTPVGEGLRGLLLDPASGAMSPFVEALLFTAARAELVRTVIAPALAQRTIAVVERCYLSTLVYQGVAAGQDGVPLPLLRELTARAQGDLWPDAVLVLDVSFDVARTRMTHKRADRIEERSRDYHERVRAGYRDLATADPRCVRIDGAADAAHVEEALRAEVTELLAGKR